ncbi:MAG: exodeoxyribonuclease VII small subunit [Bacteroidota bacterium]
MKTEFSLEEKLAEIRSLVDEMQKGVVDFDRHLHLFSRGRTLIKECREHLNEAELEVKQLIQEGEE